MSSMTALNDVLGDFGMRDDTGSTFGGQSEKFF
jgi:hypothetical protein